MNAQNLLVPSRPSRPSSPTRAWRTSKLHHRPGCDEIWTGFIRTLGGNGVETQTHSGLVSGLPCFPCWDDTAQRSHRSTQVLPLSIVAKVGALPLVVPAEGMPRTIGAAAGDQRWTFPIESQPTQKLCQAGIASC